MFILWLNVLEQMQILGQYKLGTSCQRLKSWLFGQTYPDFII